MRKTTREKASKVLLKADLFTLCLRLQAQCPSLELTKTNTHAKNLVAAHNTAGLRDDVQKSGCLGSYTNSCNHSFDVAFALEQRKQGAYRCDKQLHTINLRGPYQPLPYFPPTAGGSESSRTITSSRWGSRMTLEKRHA